MRPMLIVLAKWRLWSFWEHSALYTGVEVCSGMDTSLQTVTVPFSKASRGHFLVQVPSNIVQSSSYKRLIHAILGGGGVKDSTLLAVDPNWCPVLNGGREGQRLVTANFTVVALCDIE